MVESYLKTYLFEALVLGLLGSVIGVGVGQLLAYGAIHMLADTVNALYFATSVEALTLTLSDIFFGIILGFAFSLLAGWIPARDATQTPPAQILAKGDWSSGFTLAPSSQSRIAIHFTGFPAFAHSALSHDRRF